MNNRLRAKMSILIAANAGNLALQTTKHMQQPLIKYWMPVSITRKLSASLLLFIILLDIESNPGDSACPGSYAPETGQKKQVPLLPGNREWPELSFYRFQL